MEISLKAEFCKGRLYFSKDGHTYLCIPLYMLFLQCDDIHPLRCGSLSSNLGGSYDYLDQRSMMEAKLCDSQASLQQGHSFCLALSPLGSLDPWIPANIL